MKKYKSTAHTTHFPTVTRIVLTFITLFTLFGGTTAIASAATPSSPLVGHSFAFNMGEDQGQYHCGGGSQEVATSINIGCTGKGNALVDAFFAIIRFLSVGVGLIVVASLVWAGVQYSASKGDPGATAKAMERIQSTLIALLVYIFAAALLDFIIPGHVIQV